jgi:hypothetical protein
MNKIIQVINTMISNSGRISNVLVAVEEYFFIYNDKHKWSIMESKNDSDAITLFLYPDENIKLETLAYDTDYETYSKFVTYRAQDFKSSEVIESYRELLKVVKDKIYGVDDILDEILKE